MRVWNIYNAFSEGRKKKAGFRTHLGKGRAVLPMETMGKTGPAAVQGRIRQKFKRESEDHGAK